MAAPLHGARERKKKPRKLFLTFKEAHRSYKFVEDSLDAMFGTKSFRQKYSPVGWMVHGK